MIRLLLSFLLILPAAAQLITVDPHAPADLITQVNALALACNFTCTIHIPAGDYTVASGTILIHHNTLSLVGDGRNNTIIHYAGLNFLDSRLDASTYNPSFSGSGLIAGFTLICTNLQVHCITGGSVIGQRWQDLSLVGPAGVITAPAPPGTHAEAFTFQNTFAWMERTVFRDITVGGFNINFHFMAPRDGGTDSFGYALFDGIWTNQGARSRSFVVDPGAGLYNVLGFTMQFNSAGTTPADEVFSIGGGFTGVGFHVTGENAGAPITFAHIFCGGGLHFEGDYNIFGGDLLTDCPRSDTNPTDPFRVAPSSGLAGIRGSIGGNAVIPDFTALGQLPAQKLFLWAYQAFNLENPHANAYNGFVMDAAGHASPFTVFDPDLPWCLAVRVIYAQPANVVPRLCLSGAGDLATVGSLRATTLRTTRPTPASSHEACTPGDSWDDDNFHYHCTSTTQIKRIPLTPF